MIPCTVDKREFYLQAIQDVYPGLQIYSVRLHTSQGQFNDIVFVNDDLIFRFPRYEESIGGFLKELLVLQKLQGHLSLPVPDPVYASTSTSTPGRVFMGYKALSGNPLFRDVLNSIADPMTLKTIAQQMVGFLHGLHSLSSAELGLDLPLSNGLTQARQLYRSIQEQLFQFMHPGARNSVVKHFEEYFSNTSLHEYVPSMIHGDFGGSNILFERDRLTGVIDFSSAGIGDPAMDIAAVSTFGDSFFARFCSYYRVTEAVLDRARFYHGTYALQEALHGLRNHDPGAFRSGMKGYL